MSGVDYDIHGQSTNCRAACLIYYDITTGSNVYKQFDSSGSSGGHVNSECYAVRTCFFFLFVISRNFSVCRRYVTNFSFIMNRIVDYKNKFNICVFIII